MKHPTPAELALYAGNDCGLVEQWRIGRHLRRCAACHEEVDGDRAARQALRECAADTPGGLNWERLAEEMTGNIRVGLAAGECVGDFPAKRHIRPVLGWSIATSMVMVAVLLIAALAVNLQAPRSGHLMGSLERMLGFESRPNIPVMTAMPATAVLEASPEQIELLSNGTAMTMVPQQASSDVTVSLSLQGSASQRVVNPDTGQVTISQVYYAQ